LFLTDPLLDASATLPGVYNDLQFGAFRMTCGFG